VIWGAIHGILLAYERMIGKESIYHRFPRPIRIGINFFIVLITWVFFRSDNLSSAIKYLGSMFGASMEYEGALLIGSIIYSRYHILIFLCCVIVVWFGKHSWQIAEKVTPIKVAIMIILFIISLMGMFTQSFNPFLYFQF
jgi:alginate O-acetyltransferase complex protein AlgI